MYRDVVVVALTAIGFHSYIFIQARPIIYRYRPSSDICDCGMQ